MDSDEEVYPAQMRMEEEEGTRSAFKFNSLGLPDDTDSPMHETTVFCNLKLLLIPREGKADVIAEKDVFFIFSLLEKVSKKKTNTPKRTVMQRTPMSG